MSRYRTLFMSVYQCCRGCAYQRQRRWMRTSSRYAQCCRPSCCTSSMPVVSLLVQLTSNASRMILSTLTNHFGTGCDRLGRLYVGRFIPGHAHRTNFRLVLNHGIVREGDMNGISRGRRGQEVIGKNPGSTKVVSNSPPNANTKTFSPTDGTDHEQVRPARQVSQFSQSVRLPAGIDTAKTTLEVDAVHSTNADQVAQQAQNVGLIFHAERMSRSKGGSNTNGLDNLRHNRRLFLKKTFNIDKTISRLRSTQ